MKLNKKIFFKNEVSTKTYLRLSLLIMLLFSGFVGEAQVVTITQLGVNPVEAAPQPLINGRFRVTRTGATALPLAVTIAVTGTATPTTDYAPIATTVTIPAGAEFINVSLGGIVDDILVEGDETIIITVQPSLLLLYTVGAADTAILILEDDDIGEVSLDLSSPPFDPDASEEGLDPGLFRLISSNPNETGTTITVNYTLGGTATDGVDFNLTGVFTFPSNGTTVRRNINIIPIQDILVDPNETVVLTLDDTSNPILFPIGLSSSATITIADNDFEPTLIATDASAKEAPGGNRVGVFEVDLGAVNNTGSDIIVNFTVQGASTAVAGDYSAIGTSVSIPDGDQTGIITITPVNDVIVEGSETVILDLANGTGYTVGLPNSATVTILDDDSYTVTLTATDASAKEAPGGNRVGVFEVDLGAVNNTGSDIIVNFTVLGASTAVAGDYSAIGTSVSIPDGDQTGIITITPVNDVIVEGSETVILDLANGTGYTVGSPNSATVTILDDDVFTPTLTATDATAKEAAGGNRVGIFTVDLGSVNNTGTAIVVSATRYGTSSAVAADYANTTTNVSIADGEQTGTITITPVDDAIVEGDETLSFRIRSGTGYDVGAPSTITAAITITDDDVAGVSVNTLTGTTTEAGDVQANFIFTLTSMPLASVTININGYVPTENSGPASITIEPGEWDTGATLIILGVNDVIADGDQVNVINTGNVTSADPIYNTLSGVNVEQLTVTNLDNDGCGTTPIAIDEVQANGGIVNFCGTSFTTNLNDYTNTVPPVGMVLTWSRSSNPFNVGARLTQAESENVTSDGSFFGYLYDADKNCVSGVLEIELVLNDLPTIQGTGASNCGPGILLLMSTASPGASIKWYDSLIGGTELGTGEEYSTANLENTTSFYVQAEANDCLSERVEVIATIVPVPFSGIASLSNNIACSLVSTEQPLSAIDLDNLLEGNPDVGDWSFVSGSATLLIDADNVVNFVGQAEGDYVFRYTTNTLVVPCTMNASTEVTITVTDDCTPDPIDIEVLKSVSNENAVAGENVTFTVTVNNLSDRNVQNIIVGDLIETGFDYVSDTPSIGNYDLATGRWIINEIGALATITLEIEVTVLSEGIYTNTAELLESFPTDNNTANDSAVVSLTIDVPQGGDLAIEKTVRIENTKDSGPRANPLAGDEVVFTIKVTNLSDEVTMNQIRVSDFIEAPEFVYVSHSTVNGAYDSSSGIWIIPELLAGGEAVLEITVSVPAEGLFTNMATIVGSVPLQTDSNEEENNNSASAEVNVSLPTEADCGFVFNQFSPNGDGVNDYFKVQCIEQYPTNRLQIYDRYGNQVYIKAGYTNDWAGDGENGQVPDGTYFYLLDSGDGSEALKGWIQLIR